MRYDAVIFDLDGVLCSTDIYHYLAWKKIADEEGVYFDREINRRLRGVSREDSLEILLERSARVYTKEEKAALCERKNTIYVRSLDAMTEKDVSDEARKVLAALRNAGVKLAVGSSSKNTKLILRKTGLTDCFDGVADGTMISHSKPHPEVFIKALDLIGGRPCDTVVVEDAAAGIDAAVRGGFVSAGIGPAAEYEKTKYVLRTLSDLLPVVFGESLRNGIPERKAAAANV